MRIADVRAGQRDISIEGTVLSKQSIYTKDASKDIIVQNFKVRDESGEIGVAIWGKDKTQISNTAQEGDTLRIVNGNTTESPRYGISVHAGREAVVEVISADVSLDKLLTPEEKKFLVILVKKLKEVYK